MKESKNTKKGTIPKPVVLIILDGWGVASPYGGNAISQADTANLKELITHYPATTLRASGEAVGLPWGENGNSEVGHINIGMGRIIYQDLPRINRAISDGSFYDNEKISEAMNRAKKNKKKLHLMGLTSTGGVHSSLDHLFSLLDMAEDKKMDEVYIHAFLDGRDTRYNSGMDFIKEIERKCKALKIGKIASLAGRFYAMDRDNHWERIEKVYLAMTEGEGPKSEDPAEAVKASYAKKIYDEEFAPTVICEKKDPVGLIENGDSVIFFNFRPDRAREISKAFIVPGFSKFKRKYLKDLYFVCFIEYERDLPAEVAFPVEEMSNGLGDVISANSLKQLRIAETEKYAHVTYFFNGGREEKEKGEDRVLVSSPRVASYDLKPEMSANEVTGKLVKAITAGRYDFIAVNYANADMVGHTGNLKAAIKAVEAVDKMIGKVVRAVLKSGGVVIITADHGNAESMLNMQTGEMEKEHSSNPVPFILIGKDFEGKSIAGHDSLGEDLSTIEPQGLLSDIAPTILKIMGIEKPEEMTGRSLI